MLDKDKIRYTEVDLDEINSSQPFKRIIKEQPSKKFRVFFNIFNKTFKFEFNWRF